MNKTMLSVLVAMLLLFTSCGTQPADNYPGSDSNTEQEQSDSQKEVKRGMIEANEVMLGQPGTHVLNTPEGEEVYLKSKSVNLNLYRNITVEVRGIFERDGNGHDVMEVLAVKKVGLEDESLNVTWEDKIFPGLGIALRVPSNFETTGFSNDVEITYESAEEDQRVAIMISAYGTYTKDLKTYLKGKNPGITYEEIRLGSYSGYKEKAAEGASPLVFYLENDSDVFEIQFHLEQPDETWKKVFYQMMDSLNLSAVVVPQNLDVMEDQGSTSEGSSSTSTTSSSASTTTTTSSQSSSSNTSSDTTTLDSPTSSVMTTNSVSVGEASAAPSSQRTAVMSYLSTSGSSAVGGAISSYSFVDPNYVYVDYADGDGKKRKLLQYTVQGASVSTQVVASYVAGEDKDWEKIEGSNPVGAKAQDVYAVTDTGVEKEASIKEGFRLLDSSSRGYTIQYPSDWYYRGFGASSEYDHKVGFAGAPVEEGNVSISMEVIDEDISSVSGTSTTIGGSSAKVSHSTDADGNDIVTVSRTGDDGRVYSISGSAGSEATIKAMLETLETK